MNLIQQNLIPLDLVTFFGGDSWEVQLDKVLNQVTSIPKSPVKRIKTTTEINDLAFRTSFLLMLLFSREIMLR